MNKEVEKELRRTGKAYFGPFREAFALGSAYLAPEEEVAEAIRTAGIWQQSEEWRISTWMDFSVRRVKPPVDSWDDAFEAVAECGHRFSCVCPTLERALQFLAVYHELITRLFYESGLGWPSWRSPHEL